MPIAAYRPLDRSLTTPLAEPAAPPMRCDWHGQPTVCVFDGLGTIEDWRGVLQQCNADRATSARISAGPPGTKQ